MLLAAYLRYCVLKRISVYEASTEAEKEAVYKFRYSIYHDEYNLLEKNYNHANKTLKDPVDDKNNVVIAYTKNKDNITGTCRINYVECNQLSPEDQQKYHISALDLNEKQTIGIVERLAIRAEKRGSYIVGAIGAHLTEKSYRDKNVQVIISSCATGLLKYYMSLGFRPYTTELIQYDDRVEIPIAFLPDLRFQKRFCTLASPITSWYILKSLEKKFYNFKPDIIEKYFSPKEIIADIKTNDLIKRKDSFLYFLHNDVISYLIKNGFFLQLKKGQMLFSEKERHHDKYVLIKGKLSASRKDVKIYDFFPGDITGELCISDNDKYRFVSAIAAENSLVLILPRNIDHRLFRSNKKYYANYCNAMIKSMAARDTNLIKKLLASKKEKT